jgi:hypothetical protein
MLGWLRILIEPETGNATVNAWRMASLKSFFGALLPGQTALSLAAYAASTAGVVFWLLRAWARARVRPVRLSALWATTCLAAVLIDPHLVDYDLTVLVAAAGVAAGEPAGCKCAGLAVQLRWWMVALYLTTLVRAQVPLGEASLPLTTALLAACALVASRSITTGRTPLARARTVMVGAEPSGLSSP